VQDPYLNWLQAPPRERPEAYDTPCSRGRSDLDWIWGPSLPHDRCPHTRGPLKSQAHKASEPTSDEGVTRSSVCGLATAHRLCCIAVALEVVS
jgi:hypothetical protein